MAEDANVPEPARAPPTVVLDESDDDDGRSPMAPRRGEQVGRFVVLDAIGLGGMGVVVSAYDPELDRKVALKLLRPDVAPDEGIMGARMRLLREARAMAKLRHPNVVTVFDVGEYHDQIFLAMEYVAGGTLITWAEERRRESDGWRAILKAFVQAGRGLEAAHAEGLVHRDFKPGNVLVEGDRFQVTDFGIASIDGHEIAAVERSPAPTMGLLPGDTTRPAAGALIGTAAYMAPELLAGKPANEQTDQFAFCVALFEALYGYRPFDGETRPALVEAIEDGRMQPPPRDHPAPVWVQHAIRRGLSQRATDRWPSMGALIDTLAEMDDPELGRRVRSRIAAAIGVCFVGLPFVGRTLGPPFDRTSYAGALGQTVALIACLLGMAWLFRELVSATALNRKVFAAVLSVLVMQLPLELTCAALGVPLATCDALHLVLWAAMASMFGVTLDRRFLILGACYLAPLPLAVTLPAYHLEILGAANAVFIAFVLVVWRRAPQPREGDA